MCMTSFYKFPFSSCGTILNVGIIIYYSFDTNLMVSMFASVMRTLCLLHIVYVASFRRNEVTQQNGSVAGEFEVVRNQVLVTLILVVVSTQATQLSLQHAHWGNLQCDTNYFTSISGSKDDNYYCINFTNIKYNIIVL